MTRIYANREPEEIRRYCNWMGQPRFTEVILIVIDFVKYSNKFNANDR